MITRTLPGQLDAFARTVIAEARQSPAIRLDRKLRAHVTALSELFAHTPVATVIGCDPQYTASKSLDAMHNVAHTMSTELSAGWLSVMDALAPEYAAREPDVRENFYELHRLVRAACPMPGVAGK